MPDCFLHIGAHKSGSTTIQAFLRRNRRKLRSLGYHVPQAGVQGAGAAHHHLAYEFAGSANFDRAHGGWADLIEEVKSLAGEHLILSSEAFERPMAKPHRADDLRRRLADVGYGLKVILYLREQDAYMNSAFATQVRHMRRELAFERFIDDALEDVRFDYWGSHAALLEETAIETNMRPFSRSVLAGGLCRDFLSALGLDAGAAARFEEERPRNASPGPKTVAALLRIRQLAGPAIDALPRHERSMLARDVGRAGDRLGWNGEAFYGLDPDTRRRIRERFAASNDRIAQAAWGRPWGDVFAGGLTERQRNVFDYGAASEAERREFDSVVDQALRQIRSGPSLPARLHRRFLGLVRAVR